jgi:hypothetical protein
MTTTGPRLCLPRFGTPRNPDRRTLGPEVAEVARRLGKPLMPWQRHVVDVAYEVDESGALVYDEVNLTVPRQSGKTTLLMAVMAHRCVVTPRRLGPQNIVYTAQDRNAARRKWEREHLELLRSSRSFREIDDTRSRPVKATEFRVRLQRGDEHILWGSGSRWGIDTPSKTAGHGDTLDVGVIDEAFARQDDAVEQAMRPAQATRRDKQLWVLSTAGDDSSPYLYRKVLAGRETSGGKVAYFEWSIPEDVPIDDEAVWWEFLPALGHTIDVEFIRSELERNRRGGGEGLWRRAYGNQWVNVPSLGRTSDAVIPVDAWAACHRPDVEPDGPGVLSVDVNPERSAAAIGFAGFADGVPVVDLVEHSPGTRWAVARLVQLSSGTGWPVVVDKSSPAGSLIDELHAAGIEVRAVTAQDQARSCGLLFDLVTAPQPGMFHIDVEPTSRSLLDALAGAKRRPIGDAWAWSRRNSTVDVSPLVAVTLALGSLLDPAEEPPKPVFAF